ncbi:MAG: EAL domain-containing protein [Firmicutes bacterium]|nr:EAL domain-containing protein [Bacillota bacterium]
MKISQIPWQHFQQFGRLHAVFQPIISLDSAQIIAYEALSRPYSESNQALSIEQVIAGAEAAHQLEQFDRMAYGNIIQQTQVMIWPATLRPFLNIQPGSLPNSHELLHWILHHPVLSSKQFVLEVSERDTLYGQEAAIRKFLQPFRDHGVQIAIDDLGAGYSGLNRLIALMPEFAKLDLSIIRNIDTTSDKYAMVESIVRFAQQSGPIDLIAEGIETWSELRTLQDLGVPYGQGYLLGYPAENLDPLPSLTARQMRQPLPHR